MPLWLTITVVVVGVFLARAAAYAYLWWRARRIRTMFDRYWDDTLPYLEIADRKREVVRLFRAAQVIEPSVTLYQPAPYGGVQAAQGSVFENPFLKTTDVAANVQHLLLEAIGYFRGEVRRSLIPLFWPSVLFHLPGDALIYLGIGRDTTTVRAANLVGGLATIAGAFVAVLKLVG